ncbi:hypothetical protein [Desulfobacter latus]|uniref:Sulfotransferase domain-containing protein n=1 Tax=Desulfobacter latus TaxID=2292 RepID=A0A850T1S4_9BACT|nr:hypothetical protein [Desulfobacter latus]NWH05663.1 hypothetical protein [Desulfobacter latus]
MSDQYDYNILIHPGFAKAMTTFMQDVVFSHHSRINHIGREYWRDDLPASICYESADLMRDIAGKDTIDFDKNQAVHRLEKIRKYRFKKGFLNTISDESLSYACNADRAVIAERLKSLMPGAKILFTVRSQYTLLVSAFFWLRFTKLAIPNTFNKWIKASSLVYNDIYDDFFLRQYRYYEVIETYSQLFGKDNVIVIPIEAMAKDKEGLCRNLGNFAGVDSNELIQIFDEKPVNVRPSAISIAYIRLYTKLGWLWGRQKSARDVISCGNGLNKKIVHRLNQIFPQNQVAMDDESRQFITEFFGRSNYKLALNYNLELEKYGYPMG